MAGHRRDFLPNTAARADEQRQHEVVRPQFGLADAGEVFAELSLVRLAELPLQRLRLAEHIVEDAALLRKPPQRRLPRAGIIRHKQTLEEPLRTVLRRQRRPVSIKSQRVRMPRRARPRAIRNLQRREPRLRPDLLRDHLVRRNRIRIILPRHPAQIRPRQPSIRARMPARRRRMPQPREHGEIRPMILQRREGRGQIIPRALRRRHPFEDIHPIRHIAENGTRRRLRPRFPQRLISRRSPHRLQQRKRQTSANATQNSAARKWCASEDVHARDKATAPPCLRAFLREITITRSRPSSHFKKSRRVSRSYCASLAVQHQLSLPDPIVRT